MSTNTREDRVQDWARQLDTAVQAATAIPQLSAGTTPMDLDDAYATQRAGIDLRVRRGDSAVGIKLGFTSKAKAEQMGVFDVIAGVLTDSMRLAPGETLDMDRFIHPRIEPEVAFLIPESSTPSDPVEELIAAGLAVAPAMEIIDSRYRDFSFDLNDVVADNASAAGFVIGDWITLRDHPQLDLPDLAVLLAVDAREAATGSTRDILGDPLRALAAAGRMLDAHRLDAPGARLLLAGAATAAVALTRGTIVSTEVADLGRLEIRTSA